MATATWDSIPFMAVITQELSLGTTASLIVTGKGANPNDKHQLIISDASGDIYVGGSDVTVADGFKIGVGDVPFELPISLGDAVYGIAAAAQTARALSTRT